MGSNNPFIFLANETRFSSVKTTVVRHLIYSVLRLRIRVGNRYGTGSGSDRVNGAGVATAPGTVLAAYFPYTQLQPALKNYREARHLTHRPLIKKISQALQFFDPDLALWDEAGGALAS